MISIMCWTPTRRHRWRLTAAAAWGGAIAPFEPAVATAIAPAWPVSCQRR